MAQRLIIIHGRSTKPAKRAQADLIEKALLSGLERVDPTKAANVSSGKVKIDHVYYGDQNNGILAEFDAGIADTLSARDPAFGNAPCLPHDGLSNSIDALTAIPVMNRRAYRKILRENDDLRFLDDAARAISTLAAISSLTTLNMQVIKRATRDMGAYLMTRKVGSEIRERLQGPLKKALKAKDDVCLISHSMGCIVAYDVLWKFSRMSEYRDVQNANTPVRLWLTLGCPLGEAGVKANLYDAGERGEDKHPKGIIEDWVNFAAYDDFISHDATMKGDYSAMRRQGFLNSIRDLRLYNCWAHEGKSNPHKFFGYLAHQNCAEVIADWIG